jgi:nucleosome binding factor SPN SPT16 subunit
MGDIIETERKVTHMKLAERVEAKLDDQKFLKSQKLGADVCPVIFGAKRSLIQIS